MRADQNASAFITMNKRMRMDGLTRKEAIWQYATTHAVSVETASKRFNKGLAVYQERARLARAAKAEKQVEETKPTEHLNGNGNGHIDAADVVSRIRDLVNENVELRRQVAAISEAVGA